MIERAQWRSRMHIADLVGKGFVVVVVGGGGLFKIKPLLNDGPKLKHGVKWKTKAH